ncbi:hypothetical protein [Actinomadura alba]|uniref:Secreted protein n=1 Tax=Actinomadura alba TaxID=406431 RepID=A0ABR7LPD8_9ACTN|nr:hypothetical protein [Actinomadura alba]MBC6466711.1 hypothetical protein [Actinomadura alba]
MAVLSHLTRVGLTSTITLVMATGSTLLAMESRANADTWIQRVSANNCSIAEFEYTYSWTGYSPGGKKSYRVVAEGYTYDGWTCRGDGYGGELQAKFNWWTGSRWYDHPWVTIDNNADGSVRSDFRWTDTDLADVRFRMCNWNPTTDYAGTCGSY